MLSLMAAKHPIHPGVSIVAPAQPTHGWVLKWRDPDTGKQTKKTLPHSLGSRDRTRAAKLLSHDLELRAAALATGATRKTATPLTSAIERYHASIGDLAVATREAYRGATTEFLDWAAQYGAETTDDLKPDALTAFRKAALERPKRVPATKQPQGTTVSSSEPRKPRTINFCLRSTKTTLLWLHSQGLLASISPTQITTSLKLLRTPKDDATYLERLEIQEILSYLGTKKIGRDLEPLWRFLILTGMRREEALLTTWDMVSLKDQVIRLPSAVTKTKGGRSVDLSISPSVVAILEARPDRTGRVWSEWTISRLEGVIRRLRPGPVYWSPHTLRATCATYLVCAGIYPSIYRAAKRMGHKVATMEDYYLDDARVEKASTLEEAMGLTP